jgi:hypothetical protein
MEELQDQLDDAKHRYECAGYIDSFQRMQSEQARYADKIRRIEAEMKERRDAA